MPISTPSQITVPFATSGLKNAIPAAANPVTGNAGYDLGFTSTNMTPKEAGGIPPFGQDFNGILFDITTAIRYLEAGMQFPYSSTFAASVGGYPLGAIVTRTDGTGFWRNGVANNTTDPEAFGAGWSPEGSGATTVAMSSANVTLTALQSARQIVIITGTLTANLNLIFPTYQRQWTIVNNTSGAFSVTCKTASGGGVAVTQGVTVIVYGDGSGIYSSFSGQSSPTVRGNFSRLAITTTGSSVFVSITATQLSLKSPLGVSVVLNNVATTASTIVSGAAGLDTGTIAINTWYSVWVAQNPATGMSYPLLSLSATIPTFPWSGDTPYARIGWIRTDSTANFYPLGMVQVGRNTQYRVAAGTNVLTAPLMTSGPQGSVTTPTWIPISVSPFIPTTASKIKVIINGYNQNSSVVVAPNNAYSGSSSTLPTSPPFNISAPSAGAFNSSISGELILESTNIYYASTATASGLMCLGWEDNL